MIAKINGENVLSAAWLKPHGINLQIRLLGDRQTGVCSVRRLRCCRQSSEGVAPAECNPGPCGLTLSQKTRSKHCKSNRNVVLPHLTHNLHNYFAYLQISTTIYLTPSSIYTKCSYRIFGVYPLLQFNFRYYNDFVQSIYSGNKTGRRSDIA